MQTQSNNYISNYVLLIAAALLLFYAISGFTKRESSACKVTSTIQEIENKNVSIFSEGTKTPDTTSNENDRLAGKIEMVKKLLKEDEAKIMEIIFENEGITQDSLHFRTGFSHSKLSMIIKKLEEKDLIVRERFGRTYKIHLSKWVKNQ
jgi:predicted HTH transcriptional regulator